MGLNMLPEKAQELTYIKHELTGKKLLGTGRFHSSKDKASITLLFSGGHSLDIYCKPNDNGFLMMWLVHRLPGEEGAVI